MTTTFEAYARHLKDIGYKSFDKLPEDEIESLIGFLVAGRPSYYLPEIILPKDIIYQLANYLYNKELDRTKSIVNDLADIIIREYKPITRTLFEGTI